MMFGTPLRYPGGKGPSDILKLLIEKAVKER